MYAARLRLKKIGATISRAVYTNARMNWLKIIGIHHPESKRAAAGPS
jgi:hypothetical protein